MISAFSGAAPWSREFRYCDNARTASEVSCALYSALSSERSIELGDRLANGRGGGDGVSLRGHAATHHQRQQRRGLLPFGMLGSQSHHTVEGEEGLVDWPGRMNPTADAPNSLISGSFSHIDTDSVGFEPLDSHHKL